MLSGSDSTGEVGTCSTGQLGHTAVRWAATPAARDGGGRAGPAGFQPNRPEKIEFLLYFQIFSGFTN
jgi:hypothetical protein